MPVHSLDREYLIDEHTYRYHGFLTQDSLTLKSLKRAEDCIRHKSRIIWIEGEHGTGKSLLSSIIIGQHQQLFESEENTSTVINLSDKTDIASLFTGETIFHAMIINILPDLSLHTIKQFQNHLVEMLANKSTKLKFICFTSLPTAFYNKPLAYRINHMKQLFIESHHEYISLKSLKYRTNDIKLLINHFIHCFSMAFPNYDNITFPHHIMDYSIHFEWKNNVWDIQDFCLYYLQALSQNRQQHPDLNSLFQRISNNGKTVVEEPSSSPHTLLLVDKNGKFRTLSELEQEIINEACRYYRGAKSSAARDLGVGRTTLYRKLKSS